MAWLVLILWIVCILLTFLMRVALQKRRGWQTGLEDGTAEHSRNLADLAGKTGGSLALILGIVAAALQGAGLVDPVDALSGSGAQVLGLVTYAVGLTAAVGSQEAMGRSWRAMTGGPDAPVELVTGGVFGIVRNPIYSSFVVLQAGLVLVAPNWLAIVALAIQIAGAELLVRGSEEPHLIAVVGEPYEAYASRVGRFAPGIGRLR
jgi:protein-S-isoprenylcysteine O-methyltransferase Ste14